MNRLVVLFAFFFTYYQIDGMIQVQNPSDSSGSRTTKILAPAPLPLLDSFKMRFDIKSFPIFNVYEDQNSFNRKARKGSSGFCFGKKHGYKKRGSKFLFSKGTYSKNLLKLIVKHSAFEKSYLKKFNKSTLIYLIPLNIPQTSFIKMKNGCIFPFHAKKIQLEIKGGFASISPVVPSNIMFFAQ